MADLVTLGDIIRAGQRLREHLQPTPLEAAPKLGENAWLKLENANRTHSFKIRGALNAILSPERSRAQKGHHRGIVGQSRRRGRICREPDRRFGTDFDAAEYTQEKSGQRT